MFKISSKPTFTHDVEIQVPVDGGHSTEFLKTRFRVVEFSRLENLNLGDVKDQDKYLSLIVDGFEDLVDDHDKPLKNMETHTKQLLGLLYVRGPVMRAYMEAMAGAKVKN